MSKKASFALIIIIILIVASITTYSLLRHYEEPVDTTIMSGVKVGDVFIYEMVGYAEAYISRDENAELIIPDGFVDVNSTKCYRIEITKVDHPVVSFVATWEFKNGTLLSYDYMVNLENGLFYSGDDRFGSSECYQAIYATGLTAGSSSRPSSDNDPSITETRIKSYNNVDREINYLSDEYEAYDVNDETYKTLCHVYLYIQFDKQIGIMTDYRCRQIYSSDSIILTIEYAIADSNIEAFHTGAFLR